MTTVKHSGDTAIVWRYFGNEIAGDVVQTKDIKQKENSVSLLFNGISTFSGYLMPNPSFFFF